MELRLEQTCMACPEQYDVFDSAGRRVGYLRLRHGQFRADYIPQDQTFEEDVMSGFGNKKTVYRAEPKGDGIFEDDERGFYLDQALDALKREIVRHRALN